MANTFKSTEMEQLYHPVRILMVGKEVQVLLMLVPELTLASFKDAAASLA